MSRIPSQNAEPPERVRNYVRKAFLSGLALAVPVLVTILVLFVAVDFLSGFLDPLVIVVQSSLGLGEQRPRYVVEVIALVILAVVIFVIGVLAETGHGASGIERRFEAAVAELPGIGSLYESINEISDLLLASDTDSFQEVKLVEYPRKESYSLAFVTAETPAVVSEATGHDGMVTLFMPMAPNPVMGGFVIHVPEERVYEVDMSVEEGIKAIVSSGVAVNEPNDVAAGQASRVDGSGGGNSL